MKPDKPYSDFPLLAHSNGQWSARLGGKRRYFGPWATDRDGKLALERYEAAKVAAGSKPAKPAKRAKAGPLWFHKGAQQWAKKINGRTVYFGGDLAEALRKYKEGDKPQEVRTAAPGELTVHELVCRFLSSQKTRVELRQLGLRTWDSYKEVCDILIAKFGKGRAVATVGPDDFNGLLNDYRTGETTTGKTRSLGLVSVGNFINKTKVVFNFAKRNGLLTKDVVFGDVFRKPSKSALRRERQSKPRKLFKAREIRLLLRTLPTNLRAMVLLGINCGFEPHDCAGLELRHLDLDGRWINYPRPKTTVDRRAPLWRVTVAAIRAALDERPEPKSAEHDGRVFITRCGVPWELQSAISGEFAKAVKGLKAAALKDNRRLCFLALRHTFQTIAEKRDKEATRAIMGHAPLANDMSVEYSEERIEDARLRRVANYVFKWLADKSQSHRAAKSAA